MDNKRQPTAIIIADAHFHVQPDPAEMRRVERFLDLLAIARQADHLVLLGDIFDFWFDYPHFRLDGYDALLQGLDEVCRAGVKIHFIGGNHDIWASRYFHERYGSEPDGGPVQLELGGLRVRFEHGDGLLSHDWLYSTFRAIVRTTAGIALAKSLHPEILFAISTWLSGKSRNASRDEGREIEDKAAAWLAGHDGGDWNLMVMGHVHHNFEVTVGGRTLCAPAGWFDRLEYGLIRDGELVLQDFDRDPPPEL